uniref:small ribosomal subunit protein mS34 n=1 Tax=Myxine glutinosa TaxID=7769 RepID=UPI00358EFB2D
MVRKQPRPIAELAKKVREMWALQNPVTDSQRFALNYETMVRPMTGRRIPARAHDDVRNERRLFQIIGGLRMFGIGRIVTRKTWLMLYDEPCYWRITKVKVDHTAEDLDHGKAWGLLTFRGATEDDVREIPRVMYHDWRLVPRHEEEAFIAYTAPPRTPPLRFVPFPPLLRAVILASWQKEGRPLNEEPMLDLYSDTEYAKGTFEGIYGRWSGRN